MIKKLFISLIVLLMLAACATLQYSGVNPTSEPTIGGATTSPTSN